MLLCLFSWQLPFLLILFIPIAYADWNFDPHATDNSPSSPLLGFATSNGLPEDLSVTASDQTQRNTISNEFELNSDQSDGMIPEGLIMAESVDCLHINGRKSRKMRVRRDQGVCGLNSPQQLRNVPQTPNTEEQNKPQGQITGAKDKKRKSVTVIRVTPDREKDAELWFPKENRPKSDTGRCRTPQFDIPVCAKLEDSVEMFPAIMGLGPVCVVVPVTLCMFPLLSLQWTWKSNLSVMITFDHL